MEMRWALEREMQAEAAQRIARVQTAAVDDLRVHFGKEYRPTIELINRMAGEGLGKHGMDAKQRGEFLSMRFADGTALGEHPAFVKWMGDLAREKYDAGAFEPTDEVGGANMDARKKEIMGKRWSDPKEYERLQPELDRIIAAENRRNGVGQQQGQW